MTDQRGKSNMEKYLEVVEKVDAIKPRIAKIEDELANMNPDTKGFIKKMDTLDSYGIRLGFLEKQAYQLSLVKDVNPLSDTCKSYLMDLFVFTKYGRTKDVKVKYWDKGLMNEEESIDTYSFATNTLFEKNKVRKSNAYLTGEIDFPSEELEIIFDMKTSWDLFTFWGSYAKGISDMEWWQMQGYMWLWDIPTAKICKVLTNTPSKLIENEKKNLLRDFLGTTEEYDEACLEIEKNHTYDDIPSEEKIIELTVQRDDDAIASIPKRVEQCRDYLNSIKVGELYEMARRK
jgi:hypothetical protein